MRLMIVLCLAAAIFGQVAPRPSLWVGEGEPPIRILGSGYSFQESRYAALYTFGPRLDLNPTATWPDAPANLLPCSDDMTCAGWSETGSGSVNDATHFTFAAQNDAVHQSYTLASGVVATLYVRARAVTGNTALHLYHSGITPASTAKTFTASLADYAATITGDGGAVTYGVQDQNAAGFGQIELTRIMLIPGSYAASEAAAIYEKTAANRESITDWSGHGATLCNGGNCSTTSTNSASNSVGSYNLLAANGGDFTDTTAWLRNAAPTLTAGQVDPNGGTDATKFEISVVGQGVYQASGNRITTIAGGSVIGSVYLKGASGGERVRMVYEHANGNNESTKTLTTEWVRYTLAKTTSTANLLTWDIYAADSSATWYAAFPQIERVPAGTTTPLPYASAASPVLQCVSCDLTTDDYLSSTVTLANDWTFHALIRPDDITSVGLWRNGTSYPKISLDANSKVVYTNGTDTVTSTNAITAGLWHIITVVNRGGTIYHYLDGAANGSGDASSASNAFAALQIGYDGSNYFDGAFAAFAADDAGVSARAVYGNGSCSSSSTASESRLIRQCGAQGKLAWEAWNNRSICTVGYRALGFCASAPTELP